MEERATQLCNIAATTPKNNRQKVEDAQSKCKICGAKGHYLYAGVLTCPPCKMFFKRNALTKSKQLKCEFNGHCEINSINRHICSYCRLKKCFASGMQAELLRGSRPIPNKRHKMHKTMPNTSRLMSDIQVGINGRNRPQKLPTLNLLQCDQSTLSEYQWTLLSNLLKCYDDRGKYIVAKQYSNEQSSLPIKLRYKFTSLGQLCSSLWGGAQLLFEKNFDYVSLNTHDRSLLLHGKFKHVGFISICFLLRHVGLYEDPTFYTTAETMYGPRALLAAKLVSKLVDLDIVFFKLGLAILIFSTFDYTVYTDTPAISLVNAKLVSRIQDQYIEVAWKYLVYKYGHERAVISFSNFIRCIFANNEATIESIKERNHTDMLNTLVTQIENSLSVHY